MSKPRNRHHKVKARLAVIGVSTSDLCRTFNIDNSHFSYWSKSDHRNVQSKTLEHLAGILGVEVGYLTDMDSWDGLLGDNPEWVTKLEESE